MSTIGKACFALSFLFLVVQQSAGQVPLPWEETFVSYANGPLVDNAVWFQYGAGVADIQVASGALTHPDYGLSGVGKKIVLDPEGWPDIALFASQNSGTVYCAFLARFTSINTDGNYFFHFTNDEGGESVLPGRLFAKDNGAGNLALYLKGIKSDDSSSVYDAGPFSSSTVYLLVVAYRFNGGAGNDQVLLWVNPDLGGPEPAADVTHSDGQEETPSQSIGGIVFGQFEGGPDAEISGLRVGTSWSNSPLPVQITNFAAKASRSGVDLTWSTATEVNNYGFEIERRPVLGSTFQAQTEAKWATVGFVRGAGTSTSPQEYSYSDFGLEPGRYAYRIKQIDFGGASTYYSAAEVEVGAMPEELALEPNYPNPFNPSTNISFTVPQDGHAVLKVFNMLGQEVATLFNEQAEAGRLYKATFDASSLPTGVYVSRLEFAGQAVMRKMLFVK